MLQNIRDRATGPVAWFIVALISVPFALWGINSYFSGGSRPDLATVGGQTITQYQFQRAYEQKLRQLRSMLGKRFNPDMLNQSAFRQRILQNLIDRAVLTQHAQNAGYRVDDAQILGYLTQIPAFQKNGKFSPELYRALLKRQGMKPASFETSIRQGLLIQQLQGGVSTSIFTVPGDVARAFAVENESRRISYAVFKPKAFLDKVQLDDNAVENYFKAHKAQYHTSQRVKVKYLDLDLSRLASQQPAPEPAALKKLYQQEKSAQFTTDGERKVRHILIAAKNGDMAAAHKRAGEIRQKLENGAHFATLAKQDSDDKGSADDGGELGWVTRGMLPEAFQKAVFQLKPDQISEPIKSSAGWHIVEVEDSRPAKVKPFDDTQVQQTLSAQYRRQQAKQQFETLSDKMDQLSFENPNNLEPVAKALDLKVQTSGWLTQNGDKDASGLAQYPQVLKQAFSDTELNQRVTSKPVKVASGHEIVFRVANYQSAQQQPLSAVRAQVEQAAREEQADKLAAQAAANAKKAADRQGGELKKAVGNQIEVHNPGAVSRSDQKLDNNLLEAVFSMPRPRSKGHDVHTVNLADGSVAVVELQSVAAGDISKADKDVQKKLRQRLAQQASSEQFDAYKDWLRTQVSIKVHADQLKREGPG